MKRPAPMLPPWAVLPLLLVLGTATGLTMWGAMAAVDRLGWHPGVKIAAVGAIWFLGYRAGHRMIQWMRLP